MVAIFDEYSHTNKIPVIQVQLHRETSIHEDIHDDRISRSCWSCILMNLHTRIRYLQRRASEESSTVSTLQQGGLHVVILQTRALIHVPSSSSCSLCYLVTQSNFSVCFPKSQQVGDNKTVSKYPGLQLYFGLL